MKRRLGCFTNRPQQTSGSVIAIAKNKFRVKQKDFVLNQKDWANNVNCKAFSQYQTLLIFANLSTTTY